MRKYYSTFSQKNLAGNAGLLHLGRSAEKLGIQKMLDKIITIQRAPNADFQVSDAVTMLMMSVLSGIKHMAQTVMVKNDEVLRALFRWYKFPDATTFGRIFRLFSPGHFMELAEVENAARRNHHKLITGGSGCKMNAMANKECRPTRNGPMSFQGN